MENSFPIATMLNKINAKKKSISNFDYSTLYTTILHKFLLKVPSEVINFFFKSKVRKCIGFSKISIYWSSRGAGRRCITKQTLVIAMFFLMNKYFVTLLVKWFSNKILLHQLALTQQHFGPTSFFISLNLSIQNNSSQTDLRIMKNIY